MQEREKKIFRLIVDFVRQCDDMQFVPFFLLFCIRLLLHCNAKGPRYGDGWALCDATSGSLRFMTSVMRATKNNKKIEKRVTCVACGPLNAWNKKRAIAMLRA